MAPAADPRAFLFPSRRRALALVGAGLLVASAACAPAVLAERTAGYDLESAKTYAWITEELVLIEFGEAQPNVRTKDNERRIRAAIDRELAARGLTLAPRDQATLLVAFSVGVRIRYRLEGGSPITGPAEPQTKGTLNIYLLDRAQETEVWHGSTSKWLRKSDDPDAVANEAVAKIMGVYPNPAP
jgi:Domain of unknown function (DUF4136)